MKNLIDSVKRNLLGETVQSVPASSEWHIVSNGDLPTNLGFFLIVLNEERSQSIAIGTSQLMLVARFNAGRWEIIGGLPIPDITNDVIAWRELPSFEEVN